ncbi:MAG: hypothetical protein JXB32_04180 [Deltaproteobacteria bacterium]|nr:hypothetical protein [Deltaproteobacteria bacterium]
MLAARRWGLGLLLLGILGSCGRKDGVYEGATWQATVHQVRYQKDFGADMASPVDGLVVELSIRYVGAEADVSPPAVELRVGDGEKQRATMVVTQPPDQATDLIMRTWLGFSSTTFPMETGDGVSKKPLRFVWEMPEGQGPFTLHVGDLPPIPIRP